MSNLNTQTEDGAQAVLRVTGKCLLANRSVERLAHLDPEKRQSEKSKYEHHLLEAIAAALSIKDEFYKGLAIRQETLMTSISRRRSLRKSITLCYASRLSRMLRS